MANTKSDLSPIRHQYLSIKKNHRDQILFFRLGDFYEAFDEDAKTISDVLDIVLTSRNVGGGNRVPMAGIPHHAMENYLSRLISRGYHVAICEQVGTEPVNGLMPREVVRVVTPGTVIEEGLLSAAQNNYLASIWIEDHYSAIAYTDITTGEFAVTTLPENGGLNMLRAELTRLAPAEVIHPEKHTGIFDGYPGFYTPRPDWQFEYYRCEDTLHDHFKVSTLDGFGLKGQENAIKAAGALVQYVQETQPAALKMLSSLSTFSIHEFMTLDASTRRNLELTETIRNSGPEGTLLGVLDKTITPMGKRLLRQWVGKPLLNVQQINQRLDLVKYFFNDGLLRAEIRQSLKPLSDLERLTNRILGGSAQPRDLVSLRTTLQQLPVILGLLPLENEVLAPILSRFDLCEQPLALIEQSLTEDPPATLQNTGIIRPGYSAELDEVMNSSHHARIWIANLEASERERTQIKNLKVGYNKVFGYYIEISRSHTEEVPENYIRKQTLVNAERFITPEMKEYESQVLNAEEAIHKIELQLFQEICAWLSGAAQLLLNTANALAMLDVTLSLAEVAALKGYVRPNVVEQDVLEIYGGRHPVVEDTLENTQQFIPNDTIFEENERIRLITGPNMSGKSTYLRQVAVIALMAQMGSFVPADAATIGIIDRIFTRIGAQDEIHAGQSTFMVEMVETANILHHATSRSLLVLDEIGRGTSTYDGVSIAWAVVEYIHNEPKLRAKTLFATHYHELTQMEEILPGIKNYNVAVNESHGKIVFMHKIIKGHADQSYGIHVGQLAGLPKPVISRANEILRQLEASSGNTVKIDPMAPQQMAFFPETNPLVEELAAMDVNALSPIEALTKLFEWQKKYLKQDKS
jgi:DNA mismatch repair protein MutS